MEFLSYKPSTTEILIFSAAAGVAVATVSLVINMLWEAVKYLATQRVRALRRCAACTEPAEPGSVLCYKHTRISAVVRGRKADAA